MLDAVISACPLALESRFFEVRNLLDVVRTMSPLAQQDKPYTSVSLARER